MVATQQHTEARQAGDALEHERSQLQGQLVAYECQLPEAYRDTTSLATAIAAQQRLAADLNEALHQAQTALRAANEQLSRATATWQERERAASMAAARLDEEEVHVADKRQAAGFYDAAAYQQARRSEAEIDALRGALEQFDAQHSAATARVSRAAAAAARLTPPDLPALTAAVLTARDQLETAQQTQATLQSELTQLQRLRTAAQAEVIEQEELAAQYAVVQEVAQVASGDNPLRITFHRYVLAALLGQVLIDASHRLQVMSAARTSRTRALSRYRLSSSRSCAPTWRR